jgi:hypothetical protein
VHSVGEFNSVRREGQRGGHRRFTFRADVLEAEQFREGAANRTLVKSVEAAEHPAGLEQYRFRDPDGLGCEQPSRRSRLFRLVVSQQPD